MKMLDWLVGYRKDWLRPDIIAGLITAAVVIPKAMAYATVAGLPVQAGLYTAFVPMLIYAVLGSSRVLSVSTTTTIAILTGTELALVVPNGDPALLLRAAASLTLMVGVLLVVASILRVGFLANFISEPVLSGFKAGIGVVIVLDQVPKLLGVHFPKGSFLQNLLALFQSLPDTSAATLAVSLVMMALLLGLKRFVPQVPAPLVTVAAGIAATSLLGLEAYGVETVGEIQRGLPALTLPDFSLMSQLWPGALGIALMSFTETMAAGRAFAQSGEPALRPNQELLATGIATAGGAVLGGMPAGGGTSQTAVNRLAGARSQLAGLDHGWRDAPDPPVPCAPDQPDAAGDAGGGRDRLLRRADSTAGVPGDPGRPAHGVHLGGRRIRRGHAARVLSRASSSPSSFPWCLSRSRWATRRCTGWAASGVRACSARSRKSIPTTRSLTAS